MAIMRDFLFCKGRTVGVQLVLSKIAAVQPVQTSDDNNAAGRLLQRPKVHH